MPAGAGLADGLADPTVAVYTEAERIMLERVAKRLAKGLSNTSWAEEKLAEVQALRGELTAYLADLDSKAADAATQAVGAAYRLGIDEADADLALGGLAATAATNTYTVGVIVADTLYRLRATHLRVLRTADDAYRSVIAQTAEQVAAGTMTRREACQAALWRFSDQGVTGFVDSAGRNWDLASYAEMATRTAVGHAAINGHLETLSANDHDLVIVSNVGGECQLCRPWEGRVLSISGRSSNKFSVDEARGEGLFHPGCRHNTGAYFEGITPPMGPTEDPQGDEDRQKLRYLERQVRGAKLREATAIDDKAAAEARARIAAYQAKIRAHVDETGLLRQRHREQITETARLRAAQKPATAPEKPTEAPLPEWAKGGAIERARAAMRADGGFLPLTDANGKIRDDAWREPRNLDGWVRPSGEPSERAYGHLAHLRDAGAEIDAEIEKRSGGYFAKLGTLGDRNAKAEALSNQLAKEQSRLYGQIQKADMRGDYAKADKLQAKLAAVKAKWSQAQNDWGESVSALVAHKQAFPADTFRQVLGELRPLGGKLDNVSKFADKQAVDYVEGITKFYPSDWVARGNRDDLRQLRPQWSTRRGFYQDGTGILNVGDYRGPALAVHEYGHRMEHANLDVRKSEWLFYHSRTEGEAAEKLNKLSPGHSYESYEIARPDKFSEPYMGKDYGTQPRSSYELLTMGMEFYTHGNYGLDADYRSWLLGTLGLL